MNTSVCTKLINLFCLLVISTSSAAELTAHAPQTTHEQIVAPPKNIIYLIADGMGQNYLSAYTYYLKQQNKPWPFEGFSSGIVTTYPEDKTWVTDSAAAATALATGIKSYNGAIAVNKEQTPLKTLFEYAKDHNMRTGLAVTSQVTHATPASFYAHVEQRKQYELIANWLSPTQNPTGLVDIILGGGQKHLIRDDKHIVNELKREGYQYITHFNQLTNLQAPSVGLFHPSAFPKAIDSSSTRLAEMTQAALNALSKNNKNGFVFLVEGSQIDWCGHNNEIACVMAEMDDFFNALSVASHYQANNPDTLIIVTSDHETGGLSLGRNKDYIWYSDKVQNIKSSASVIATDMLAKPQHSIAQVWAQHVNFELDEKDIASLKSAYLKGQEKHLRSVINTILNIHTNTGWTTKGHTASHVSVFAKGPHADQFTGFQDNTDIGKKLIKLVNKHAINKHDE